MGQDARSDGYAPGLQFRSLDTTLFTTALGRSNADVALESLGFEISSYLARPRAPAVFVRSKTYMSVITSGLIIKVLELAAKFSRYENKI